MTAVLDATKPSPKSAVKMFKVRHTHRRYRERRIHSVSKDDGENHDNSLLQGPALYEAPDLASQSAIDVEATVRRSVTTGEACGTFTGAENLPNGRTAEPAAILLSAIRH